MKVNIISGGYIIAYAYDNLLVTKKREIMDINIRENSNGRKKDCAKDKCKQDEYNEVWKKNRNKKVKLGVHEFEEVGKFNYLGTMLCNYGYIRI